MDAALPLPRYIDATDPSPLSFSVCSLVADQTKYDRLLASFARLGFTPENTEFLAADNRNGNVFDGYTWTKTLLAHARGRYVIFCHDDVELIEDGYDALLGWTDWLDRHDPSWLLAGVAGGIYKPGGFKHRQLALHISDINGADRRRGTVPGRVETLDECFILMRRTRPVISSYDLNGFHYYGPDICLQAELLGGSSYAIDFHLWHHGQGQKGRPFRQLRRRFAGKYQHFFPGRILNCTTGPVILGAAPPAAPPVEPGDAGPA
jgi:hypothetical protein